MPRRFLIIVLGISLAACAGIRFHVVSLFHARGATAVVAANTAVATNVKPIPHPADGLWAILDPGCRKPALADPRAWPKCASPFWINRNSAVVVRSTVAPDGRAPNRSYRTDYRLAAGEPLIAQVGNARDGYIFLALIDLSRDDQGRLVSATGAAFGCDAATGGAISLTPNRNGCENRSPEAIRKLAWATLQNPAALAKVAWIAPGAP